MRALTPEATLLDAPEGRGRSHPITTIRGAVLSAVASQR